MAVTNPDNIWTPDSGDNYALTTDLAATADTVQDALTEKAQYGAGTTAQRTAALSRFRDGAIWYDTDTNSEWRRVSGAWVERLGPGGRFVYASAAQSIPPTTSTVLTGWTPGGWDGNDPLIPYIGSGAFRVDVSGLYILSGAVTFSASSVGNRELQVRINGTQHASVVAPGSTQLTTLSNSTAAVSLPSGAVIEFVVRQNTGSNLSTLGSASFTTASIVRVG